MIRAVVTLVWQIPVKKVVAITIAQNERNRIATSVLVMTKKDEKRKTQKLSQLLVFSVFVLVVLNESGFSIKHTNRSVARCISNVIFEAATSLHSLSLVQFVFI